MQKLDIPNNLKDLLTTDLRIEMLEAINSQLEPFSAQDIATILNDKLKTSSVQTFLKILTIRRFLSESEYRVSNRRGRLGMRYRVVKPIPSTAQ